MSRHGTNLRIWEDSDYEEGDFSMYPQGAYDGVLVITEPGPDNRSNVGVISPNEVIKYLDGEQSVIVAHRSVLPTVNFETGIISNTEGVPQGLQLVVTYACRIAREMQERDFEGRSYLIKTARMGNVYVAMIYFDCGMTDGTVVSHSIAKHTRYFHVELLDGHHFPSDYHFEPGRHSGEPEDNDEVTIDDGPMENDNPYGAAAA